jgi:hypothetical protein
MNENGWDFSKPLTLDEFLDEKVKAGEKFFTGPEPWMTNIDKIKWQNFFSVCTEEMDDLSVRAVKLIIEYCLEILEEAEAHIQGTPTLAKLEDEINRYYLETYENQPHQFHWSLRHPVVKEAIDRALHNRFPSDVEILKRAIELQNKLGETRKKPKQRIE